MRAATLLGLALACAGCVLEAEPEEDTVDGPEGEAMQEIGESFTEPIKLSRKIGDCKLGFPLRRTYIKQLKNEVFQNFHRTAAADNVACPTQFRCCRDLSRSYIQR